MISTPGEVREKRRCRSAFRKSCEWRARSNSGGSITSSDRPKRVGSLNQPDREYRSFHPFYREAFVQFGGEVSAHNL